MNSFICEAHLLRSLRKSRFRNCNVPSLPRPQSTERNFYGICSHPFSFSRLFLHFFPLSPFSMSIRSPSPTPSLPTSSLSSPSSPPSLSIEFSSRVSLPRIQCAEGRRPPEPRLQRTIRFPLLVLVTQIDDLDPDGAKTSSLRSRLPSENKLVIYRK